MGEARKTLDKLTAAYFSGDTEAAKKIYADDAIGVAPDGQEFKGPDEILDWMSVFFKAFPDAKYEPIAKYESGKVAIDEGMFIGTNTGPLQTPTGEEIPPTGKRISVRGADVVTVSKGRVTNHHFYFDQMSMLSQLGLAPQG